MMPMEHEFPGCWPVVPPHLRTKIDRDDLLQEVRARILRAEPSSEGRTEAEERAYVNKTIRSVALEIIRTFDRGKRRVASECALPPALVSDHTTPGSRAARNELRNLLADALSALPEDQRRAIELKHLESLSLAEAAMRMNKSRQAVAGLLRRGLKNLRVSLGAEA
jgi:RNA polymerase sigma-70 factor (ECF subfamily)